MRSRQAARSSRCTPSSQPRPSSAPSDRPVNESQALLKEVQFPFVSAVQSINGARSAIWRKTVSKSACHTSGSGGLTATEGRSANLLMRIVLSLVLRLSFPVHDFPRCRINTDAWALGGSNILPDSIFSRCQSHPDVSDRTHRTKLHDA